MSSVYIIAGLAAGPCKIGFSAEPEKRLRSLQTASPLPLAIVKAIEVGHLARDIEGVLHRRLKRHRVAGEWFNIDIATALAALRSVAEDYATHPQRRLLRTFLDRVADWGPDGAWRGSLVRS